jgi:hypothetical protein
MLTISQNNAKVSALYYDNDPFGYLLEDASEEKDE